MFHSLGIPPGRTGRPRRQAPSGWQPVEITIIKPRSSGFVPKECPWYNPEAKSQRFLIFIYSKIVLRLYWLLPVDFKSTSSGIRITNPDERHLLLVQTVLFGTASSGNYESGKYLSLFGICNPEAKSQRFVIFNYSNIAYRLHRLLPVDFKSTSLGIRITNPDERQFTNKGSNMLEIYL